MREHRHYAPLTLRHTLSMKRLSDDVRTPGRVLHVTNGDHARSVIEAAGLPGACSIWSDPLYEGPVPGDLADEALIDVRAEFLSRSDQNAVEIARAFREWRRTILDAAPSGEIVLWFEHDLFDQLNLIQLVTWMGGWLDASRVSLVAIDSYPGHPEFKGFGQLTPAELAPLFDTRRDVTAAQRDLAARAWKAFTQPDPLALDRLRQQDTHALPFLSATITRLLEEYPWTTDGLSRSERRLLTLVSEQPMAAIALLPRMSERETAYYITDSSLSTMVGELSSGAIPLVTLNRDGAWGGIPNGEVSITDRGLDVLSGKRDRAEFVPIDRWHGGVHLDGESHWRWDPLSSSVTRTTR